MNSTEFLLSVWKLQCQPGDFVALSTKDGTAWRDYTFPWDSQLGDKLTTWLSENRNKNLYFCPLPFNTPRRSKTAVSRSSLLWSDIDEGDPHKVEPAILWESSPGRYAGLWKLPKPVSPEEAETLNRRLTYYIGADKGGYDLTQVLRIPGTFNYKYADAPMVKLIHFTDTVLRDVPQTALDKWRSTIPKKFIRIIEGKATQGKRSDMLWYLWHELSDLGIPLPEVTAILRASDWNKYRDRADEDERFESEMEKIRADRVEQGAVTRIEAVDLRVETYAQLMGSQASTPGWLVRDYWMRNSHGIIAGEPKSFKSTLAMDMMFSVASDRPFLGIHPVEYGGPVLIVQNENADWIMKDRLEKLAFSRGEVGNVKTAEGKKIRIEWARNLPMFFINSQGFTLDDAANKESLEELIRRIRPVAIKLDPLYLMFSGDVNSAKDLGPVLQWCLYIKQTYNCSVILVHHYNKNGESKRGGQRMLGSTTLHGWIESAWYLQTDDENIVLDREFRGAGIYHKASLNIQMGGFGDPRYSVTTGELREDAGGDEVLEILSQSAELLSLSRIAKLAGKSRDWVEARLAKLMKEDLIQRVGERYKIA